MIPALPAPPLEQAAGGVLIDGQGRVLLREPRNHYGGYWWTFPKGHVDLDESHPQAALREVREETGWVGHIVGRLGIFPGDTTETTYYLMRPVRKAGAFDHETQDIAWVTREEAEARIAHTLTTKGKVRDLAVLKLAYAAHLRMTGGRMSAEEALTEAIETAEYREVATGRIYTEAELRYCYERVRMPSYVISYDAWKERHFSVTEGLDEIAATGSSGFEDEDVGEPDAASKAKVAAALANDAWPAVAEKGKAFIVRWADGRGIFACRAKSYLKPWLEEQGKWAEVVSITYGEPEFKGKKLTVVEGVDESALSDDSARDALVQGKAVLIKNVWWAVAGRDIAKNKVCLAISKYARADGHGNAKPKMMPFSKLVANIRSGRWGANINGHYYGPKQDPKKRDAVRKANGLTAAPGAAKFRKAEEALVEGYEALARALENTTSVSHVVTQAFYALASKLRANDYGAARELADKLYSRMDYGLAQKLKRALAEVDESVIRRPRPDPVDTTLLLPQVEEDPSTHYLRLYVNAEDWNDASELDMDNDRRRLEDEAGIQWAKVFLWWDQMTTEEQETAWEAIDDGSYRESISAEPRGDRAKRLFASFDDVTVTALSQPAMKATLRFGMHEAATLRRHLPGAPARLTPRRESILRGRGFTYRANPDAPPAKRGYPPMVRAWARDESIPLPVMQRLWDQSLDEVNSSGEHDRPEPGDVSRSAVEFWKEVTRMFKATIAAKQEA